MASNGISHSDFVTAFDRQREGRLGAPPIFKVTMLCVPSPILTNDVFTENKFWSIVRLTARREEDLK